MNLTSAVSLEFRLSICPTLDTEDTLGPLPVNALLEMLGTEGIEMLLVLVDEDAGVACGTFLDTATLVLGKSIVVEKLLYPLLFFEEDPDFFEDPEDFPVPLVPPLE